MATAGWVLGGGNDWLMMRLSDYSGYFGAYSAELQTALICRAVAFVDRIDALVVVLRRISDGFRTASMPKWVCQFVSHDAF